MKDDGVAVRVEANGHVADARITRPDELNPLLFQLGPRSGHVGDAKGKAADTRLELDSVGGRIPEGKRDLARCQFARVVLVYRQTKNVPVPGARAVGVERRDRNEVNTLDVQATKDRFLKCGEPAVAAESS